MNIVVDADGKVLMWSEGGRPTPPEGGRLTELTPEQAEAFEAALSPYGLTFDGAGFMPLPAPPAPAPARITALQGRRHLRQLGIIDTITAWVATLGPDARDIWEYSTEWLRSDPLILAASAQFGLDPDEFFIAAATL